MRILKIEFALLLNKCAPQKRLIDLKLFLKNSPQKYILSSITIHCRSLPLTPGANTAYWEHNMSWFKILLFLTEIYQLFL